MPPALGALSRCSDAPSARTALVDCRDFAASHAREFAGALCGGVVRIQTASCAELGDASFLHGVIEGVGLVPDPRGRWLYGDAATAMLKAKAYSPVGLWQDPLQISATLATLGTLSA